MKIDELYCYIHNFPTTIQPQSNNMCASTAQSFDSVSSNSVSPMNTHEELLMRDESIGVCQICKCKFNPESYLIVEGDMTLPEKCQTYYTICPDCDQKTDVWDSVDSITLTKK